MSTHWGLASVLIVSVLTMCVLTGGTGIVSIEIVSVLMSGEGGGG